VTTAADLAVSAPRRDAAEELSTRILNGPAALDEHLAAWRTLAATTTGFVVFQTVDFITGWTHTFVRGHAHHDLRIILVYQGNVLAALIPVQVQTRGLVTIARLAGAPVGQYDDVLFHPAVNPARVVGAACEALRRECKVDIVLLTRVRSDSALYAACRRSVAVGAPEEAPYADLGKGGAGAFMATLKNRVRRQLAKRQRQLAELGSLEFAQAASPDEAGNWMAEALALKREWLRRTGRLSRAFVDPRTVEFLVASARAGAGQSDQPTRSGGSRLIVSRLSIGGRTAALEAGFVCRDTYHLYLGAFAPEFAKYSAGNALTEAVVRACADSGIRRYDMLAPDSRSKREWANGSVAVADLALPLSNLGRLYLLIVHQALLPTARRMFYFLPVPLRSLIAGSVLALPRGTPGAK
jgi:CelD/BcsL family acetyltransferase involved in cellulose biosynthesis